MSLKKDLDNIVDVFTAVDGGVSFAKVKFGLEDIELQAIVGDEASEEIMIIVAKFSKLLNILADYNGGTK